MQDTADITAGLVSKDDKSACALAERIIAESRASDAWYAHFEEFAALLGHPKSLVRNRALRILAANARWDTENRFEAALPGYLSCLTDEKPVTARQCVQALAEAGWGKPALIPAMLNALHGADVSKYKDSMRPLIEKDIRETAAALSALLPENEIKEEEA